MRYPAFIPHRDNPHKTRRFFASVLVVGISAGIVYFWQVHPQKSQADVYAQSAQVDGTWTEAPTAADVVATVEKNDVAPEDIISTKIDIIAPPAGRDKDPDTGLDEVRFYARPRILDGKYIDISLAYQNMVLFEDGELLDAYLVSSGRRGLETPKGTYKIENKVPRVWSKSYGLFMPYWMALVPSGKFGIHELPEWPGGYKEGADHLGVAVSHGCVRLGVGPAKRVYDWADLGTPVIVHD